MLLVLLLCGPSYLQAQSVISFAGGQMANSGFSLSFSGGEPVTGHFSNSAITLEAGFGNSQYAMSVANEVVNTDLPLTFSLNQNYPNPFNPSTNISFALPKAADVKLEVFNSVGRLVAILVHEHKQAGRYVLQFNASSLASGLYFYRLIADNQVISTQKMLLIK